MKHFTYLIIIFILSNPAIAESTIILGIGSTKTIDSSNDPQIYISNGLALKVKILGNKLLLIGKSKGHSELRLGDRKYQIQVTSKRSYHIYLELNKILENKLGLEVAMENFCPVIKGKVLKLEDWLELKRKFSVLKKPKNCLLTYAFQAKIESSIQNKVSSIIESISKFKNLRVEISDLGTLIVKSHKKKLDKSSLSVLASYGLQPIYLEENEYNLSFEIEMIAVGKKSLEDLGLNLSKTFIYNASKGLNKELLNARLNLLVQRGEYEKIIHAEILSSSMGLASFHSGGEIPIKINTENSSNVLWKKYGFLMKIKPKKSYSEKLLAKLDFEFSNIDSAAQGDQPPSIQKHELSNQVMLNLNQRNILLNFSHTGSKSGEESFSFLRGVPLVRDFFKSKNGILQNYYILLSIIPKKQEN